MENFSAKLLVPLNWCAHFIFFLFFFLQVLVPLTTVHLRPLQSKHVSNCSSSLQLQPFQACFGVVPDRRTAEIEE